MVVVRTFAGSVAALGVCEMLCERAYAQMRISDGIELSASYTFDALSNVSGGVRRGTRYLDNAGIALDIDPARFSPWKGGRVYLSGLYNNGAPFSDALVGDLQVVSNIETPAPAFRLYEAWIEQGFANDNVSVRAGLYDLNSEFDAIDSASLFLNSSHGIGADIGQTGQNGPSIFPVAGMAFRIQAALSEQIIVRAAIIEGTPGDPDHPERTVVKFSAGEGLFLISEIEHTLRQGKILYGAWTYTADFEPLDSSAPSGNGNVGAYLRGEQVLWGESSRRLTGFARVGWANPKYNPIEYFFAGGLRLSSPFEFRPDDFAGVAISWAQTGQPYKDNLIGQSDSADDQEISVELTYQLSVNDNLFVQPNVQFIIAPSSRRDVRNAVVLGVRVSAGF